jgi:diguanylate cyclase (GGDEF)-like protein
VSLLRAPRRVGAAVVYLPSLVLQLVWPGSVAADLSLSLGAFALCAAAWFGFRRHGGAARRAWLFVGIGLTAWLVGDALYLVVPADPGTTGLSLPDLGWLVGYPTLAVGIVRMVRLRAPGHLREGLLDCLVMVTGAMVAAWQLLVVPQLATARSPVQMIVQAFYPLADVTVFGAVILLVMSPGRRGAPTRLLISGLYVQLAGDVIFDVLPHLTPWLPMERFYLLPATANVLLAAAALHPDNGELTSPGPPQRAQLHPARLVFLGVALLTTPAVAVFQSGASVAARLVLLAAIAVTGAGVLARFVYAVREQEAAQRRLAHQATHDQLTGLANREEFTARLDHALAAARSGGGLPGVLFLDLDGFKPINDEYGHAVGDAVLVEVSGRLTRTVRAVDLVARIGGDEFVILCVDAGAGELTALASRVVDAVAVPIRSDVGPVRVGVSVGVTLAESDMETAAALLRAADAAMYDAKRLGRDRADAYLGGWRAAAHPGTPAVTSC